MSRGILQKINNYTSTRHLQISDEALVLIILHILYFQNKVVTVEGSKVKLQVSPVHLLHQIAIFLIGCLPLCHEKWSQKSFNKGLH